MDVKRILDLQRAGVDAEGTLGRFAGNSALYEKYLMKFPLDGTFAKIGPALRAGEWDAALNAVHTLKGISGNWGWTGCVVPVPEQLCSCVRETIRRQRGLMES